MIENQIKADLRDEIRMVLLEIYKASEDGDFPKMTCRSRKKPAYSTQALKWYQLKGQNKTVNFDSSISPDVLASQKYSFIEWKERKQESIIGDIELLPLGIEQARYEISGKIASAFPATSSIDYENFDITIRDSIGNSLYQVKAEYKNRTADGEFNHDFHTPSWENKIRTLSNPLIPPGEAAIREVGSALLDRLMHSEPVRDLWVEARQNVENGVNYLRIRLALDASIAALPWESLYDRDRNQSFATNPDTLLVRIENQNQRVGATRSLASKLPLKVLIAIPEDPSGQIDSNKELQKIMELQQSVGNQYMEFIPFTGQFNAVELRRKTQEEEANILHIVAHGEPTGLVLWESGKPNLAPASSLREVVKHAASVKLVFLNVCSAGKISHPDTFSTVAPQLLQSGVPAVIAMQSEILDDTAIQFARYLYEELITSPLPGAIDVAVSQARSNLYTIGPENFGYGTPVLWLNSPDGFMFS